MQAAARAQPRGSGGAEAFGGIDDIDQVVVHAPAFAGGRFRGADVEAAVDLPGVAADDLGAERLGEEYPDSGLSGGRCADKGDRPRRDALRCA